MNEILKYQDIDCQIKKIENDLQESEERKNASKMQQYLKDAQSKLIQLNDKAKILADTYNSYKEVFDKMLKNLDTLSKKVDETNVEKLENYVESNSVVMDNLVKLEKEVSNTQRSAEQIENEYNNIMKNARTAKSNMQVYKDAYNKLKDNKELELKKLRAELESQSKKVDKTILAKYNAKRNDKNPVIVTLKDDRCGGCRMEIPASRLSRIKNGEVIECENCGRYIYISK